MRARKPKLLSGGNPQIAKSHGDAPVRAFIRATPAGWKRDLVRRIDEVVTRAVPGVAKAVKWNSPFYGVERGVWFLSFHVFSRYVKVTFFRGAALNPPPPEKSKHADVRYFHVSEGDAFEAQLTEWVRQASRLPGEAM